MNRLVSLDLSLTAPGIGIYRGGTIECSTLAVGKKTGMERLDYVFREVRELTRGAELVVIEGLSFAHNNPGAQERAGLWFMVAYALWKAGTRVVVVAPSQLKKFVVGKGNAAKALMIREVFRRWQFEAADDNSADAYGLLRIGLCLIGASIAETQPQRDVLQKFLTKGIEHGSPESKPA